MAHFLYSLPLLLAVTVAEYCAVHQSMNHSHQRLGYTQERSGTKRMCLGNRPHILQYSTMGAVDEMFVPLDPSIVAGLTCDIDNTQILVHFRNSSAMSNFVDGIVAKTTQYGQAFLTGSQSDGSFTCQNSTAAELWQRTPEEILNNVTRPSECRGHNTCESCLAFQSFCNFCPLGGHGLFNKGDVFCDNGNVHLHTKCTKPSDCIGPDCEQKSCPAPPNVTTHEYILRRIVGYEQDAANLMLTIHAVEAKYDEIFSDANITASRAAGLECTAEDWAGNGMGTTPWCLGVNVIDDFNDPNFCKAAAGTIPIFDKTVGAGPATLTANIDCTNCFIGYSWDFVFSLQMKLFKVHEIEFGFRNMTALGALVVTMLVDLQGTVAIDKNLFPMPGGAAHIDFNIGIIPFHATLGIPTSIDATFNFDAKETAAIGTTWTANYGDNYKKWSTDNGWDHVKSTPTISHQQVFQPWQKSFSASFDFSLIPQLNYQMDNVFTYTYTISTSYHTDTEWDNQQNLLCTHANAKADAVEDAKLKINVPFIKLSLAKEWGPYVKFQWNSTLKDSCINTSGSNWKCGTVLGRPVCLPGGTLSFDDCHSSCTKP